MVWRRRWRHHRRDLGASDNRTSAFAPGEEPVSNFEADPRIQQIAEAYALDMVDHARQVHGLEIDWSDDSVQQVERIAAVIHEEYKKNRPTAEQLEAFYKMVGSYIGEVFRRNHGAEWGWVSLQGSRFPGLRARKGTLFWPWGRAMNRIMHGAEDDLWFYYRGLIAP
jgi:hypothetical protein